MPYQLFDVISLTGDAPSGDATAVQEAISTVMGAAGTVWTWMVAHPFTLIGIAIGIKNTVKRYPDTLLSLCICKPICSISRKSKLHISILAIVLIVVRTG